MPVRSNSRMASIATRSGMRGRWQPSGWGVVGVASAVKAVHSADEVNAAMKARGWEPAWSPGTPVIETTLQPGTRVNMIVDRATADSINEALATGKLDKFKLGGWGTFDDVNTVAADMRQRAGITKQFKPNDQGPFYVVDMEVQRPLNANIGFAGPQKDGVGTLRGGATQAEFLIPSGEPRIEYLKPLSAPKRLGDK